MRRSALFLLASLGLSVGLAMPGAVHAEGALGASGFAPAKEKLAFAQIGTRTVVWSAVDFKSPGGAVGVVIPVPVGTELDYSSRAFFESLEQATSTRVVPPDQTPAACPGQDPGPATFSIEGDTSDLVPLTPVEQLVLATPSDVQTWADGAGLKLTPAFKASLESAGNGNQFVVSLYQTQAGEFSTKTVRAVYPNNATALPLLLSEATNQDLRISTWALGPGRAQLGGTEVALDPAGLKFKVKDDTSNYSSLLDSILSSPDRHLVQSASHSAFVNSQPIFSGAASIDSIIKDYYTRAQAYGDATEDAATCIQLAGAVLGSSGLVGHACARKDLGVVGGNDSCTETIPTEGTDPSSLRCGGISDDLAMAFSDSVPVNQWITRTAVELQPTVGGLDIGVTFAPGNPIDPVVEASTNDLTGCGGSSSSSTTSSSSSTGSGVSTASGNPTGGSSGSGITQVPLYRHEGCSCGGDYALVDYVPVSDDESVPPAYYDDSTDSCSSDNPGDYSDNPGDGCASGDESSGSSSSDSSGCDSSSDSSSDSCSGSDDSSSGCDSSSGGDSCDSGGGDDCSGGGDVGNCDCMVGKHHAFTGHRRPRWKVRMSQLGYGTVLLLIPIRRLRRKKKIGPVVFQKRPKKKSRQLKEDPSIYG